MRIASQSLLPVALLACSASYLAAQAVPTDNDQWREHCVTLVQGGAVPSPDGSGIPAQRFEDLARERSTQGQHFVACSLFMAAAGNQAVGGNAQKSHDDIMLAKIEQKMGLGQKLSFLDKLTRSSDILANAKTTSPVTQPEVYAMSMLVQPGGAMPAPGAYPPAQYAPSGYGQGAPAQYPAAGQYAAPGGQYPAQPAQYPQQPAQYPQQQYSQPQAQYAQPQGQYPQQYPSQGAQDPYATPQPQGQYAAPSGQYPGQPQPASPSYPVAQNQYPAQYPSANPSSQGQYNPPAQAGYGNSAQYGAPAPATASPASAQFNPAKPESGPHYGNPGAMPVGRYTCYTAPAVIANGGAYGKTAVALGQFGGYMWIFDASRYAGADINNTGTYIMQGNSIIAQTGPYKGKDNKLTWAAQGEYGRPTIYLAYLDDNGNPIGGLGCTYDGPPAQ